MLLEFDHFEIKYDHSCRVFKVIRHLSGEFRAVSRMRKGWKWI